MEKGPFLRLRIGWDSKGAMNLKLSRLLHAAGLTCTEEGEITAIACHSDDVVPGALFVALEGARSDGRRFVSGAVKRGAAAVLCSGGVETSVPVLETEQPRRALGLIAAEFYGHPAEGMTTVAVTGTKGKTTTAHMLREILMAAGYRTGMIGTLGAFVDREQIAPGVNTTPEPVTLHRLLRQMADMGCTHVVMEVSSQAMKLHRLEGVRFDVGIFLNLSPDHIGPGEHENFEEYRDCKAKLFGQCRRVVGNAADPAWQFMAAHIPAGIPVHTFGQEQIRAGEGLTTVLELPGRMPYVIPLPGGFNGQNGAAAVTAAELLGISDGAIRQGLTNTAVPGRCMVYPVKAPYGVVIDYAHNGASFAALFRALRQQDPKRIIAVFGAGGDRPPMRRTEMARAAAEGADFAVITADNPRSEPVEAICAQISAAMPDLPHVIVPDRKEAIFRALDMAGAGDVVALLGKGHEEYIETDGVRRHFSEREILDEYFKR